jgi:hypothetical protein
MDHKAEGHDLKATETKHDYEKVIELLHESIEDTEKALEEVEKKAQRLS